jgi:hypothetical protein
MGYEAWYSISKFNSSPFYVYGSHEEIGKCAKLLQLLDKHDSCFSITELPDFKDGGEGLFADEWIPFLEDLLAEKLLAEKENL